MSDISTITAVMGGVKHAIDLAKFINDAGATLDKSEIKFKLSELTSSLADLKVNLAEIKIEMLEKNAEISSLKETIKLKKNMSFERPFYFITEGPKKEGPFCAQCFDSEAKAIRLHEPDTNYWKCMTCDSFYDVSPKQDFPRFVKEYDPFDV